MRTTIGALVPAIGWFLASFGLAMPTAGGSVIITNTTAGEWYLYGGAAVRCSAGSAGHGAAAVAPGPRPVHDRRYQTRA